MGTWAALVSFGLLAVTASSAAPSPAEPPPALAPSPAEPPPALAPSLERADVPRLHVPPFRFGHPTTLYILGEGRLGTWSLVGGTIGALPCFIPRRFHCSDRAVAEVGIAWRPFGSPISPFSGVGMASGASLPSSAPVDFRFTTGFKVDLPPLVTWRTLRGAR